MTTTPKPEAHIAPKPEVRSSADVIRKHKEYIWPSVSNYYQQPLVADRGSMQYIWDLDGRKYLDSVSPACCASRSATAKSTPAKHR